MAIIISRKNFLATSALSTAGMLFGKSLAAQDPPQKPPPLDKELVKEFVVKSHSDFGKVKELYTLQPGLLNCSWDWGGGDFETGLEAAGHVGNKEIARFSFR